MEKEKIENQPDPSVSSIEVEHLDSITLDGYETANGLEPVETITENAASIDGILTEEQFFEGVFKPLHNVPGQMFRLQSLPIHDGELEAARAASQAIYETCLEVDILRFLIQPGNIWLQRALVIYVFAAPKAGAVRAEIQYRKQQAQQKAEKNRKEHKADE
jgi:hypothetical protein